MNIELKTRKSCWIQPKINFNFFTFHFSSWKSSSIFLIEFYQLSFSSSPSAKSLTPASRIPVRTANAEKRARELGLLQEDVDESSMSPSELRALRWVQRRVKIILTECYRMNGKIAKHEWVDVVWASESCRLFHPRRVVNFVILFKHCQSLVADSRPHPSVSEDDMKIKFCTQQNVRMKQQQHTSFRPPPLPMWHVKFSYEIK